MGASTREEMSVRHHDVDFVRRAWRGPGQLDVVPRRPIFVLSENMTPESWMTIVNCNRHLMTDDAEGLRYILNLHGTDTMAFTASAMGYQLSDTEVPIGLTGSTDPASDKRC